MENDFTCDVKLSDVWWEWYARYITKSNMNYDMNMRQIRKQQEAKIVIAIGNDTVAQQYNTK